jgi:hypothetical protein
MRYDPSNIFPGEAASHARPSIIANETRSNSLMTNDLHPSFWIHPSAENSSARLSAQVPSKTWSLAQHAKVT